MKDEKQIQAFQKAEGQLHVFLREVGELSKKKPNDPLNKFKLHYINAILKTLNELLSAGKPFPDFEIFDPEQLPSNSDVRFLLAQYATSVFRFREEHSAKDSGGFHWYWKIGNKVSRIETESPNQFRPPG